MENKQKSSATVKKKKKTAKARKAKTSNTKSRKNSTTSKDTLTQASNSGDEASEADASASAEPSATVSPADSSSSESQSSGSRQSPIPLDKKSLSGSTGLASSLQSLSKSARHKHGLSMKRGSRKTEVESQPGRRRSNSTLGLPKEGASVAIRLSSSSRRSSSRKSAARMAASGNARIEKTTPTKDDHEVKGATPTHSEQSDSATEARDSSSSVSLNRSLRRAKDTANVLASALNASMVGGVNAVKNQNEPLNFGDCEDDVLRLLGDGDSDKEPSRSAALVSRARAYRVRDDEMTPRGTDAVALLARVATQPSNCAQAHRLGALPVLLDAALYVDENHAAMQHVAEALASMAASRDVKASITSLSPWEALMRIVRVTSVSTAILGVKAIRRLVELEANRDSFSREGRVLQLVEQVTVHCENKPFVYESVGTFGNLSRSDVSRRRVLKARAVDVCLVLLKRDPFDAKMVPRLLDVAIRVASDAKSAAAVGSAGGIQASLLVLQECMEPTAKKNAVTLLGRLLRHRANQEVFAACEGLATLLPWVTPFFALKSKSSSPGSMIALRQSRHASVEQLQREGQALLKLVAGISPKLRSAVLSVDALPVQVRDEIDRATALAATPQTPTLSSAQVVRQSHSTSPSPLVKKSEAADDDSDSGTASSDDGDDDEE